MKKAIGIIIFSISCINIMAQTNGNDYIFGWDYDDAIGVVSNNEIRLFRFYDDWQLLSDNFKIQDGYTDIISYRFGFSIYDTIGIVNNNRVHFYGLSNGWHIIPGMDLDIEYGYKKVFNFVYSHNLGNSIGIVIDNKVKIYFYNDYLQNWQTIDTAEFDLPNEYENVFCYSPNNSDCYLGVITNNKAQFYRFSYENLIWQNEPDYYFLLPDEYINVFGWGRNLCVVLSNTVKFYYYDSNNNDNTNSGWRKHDVEFNY